MSMQLSRAFSCGLLFASILVGCAGMGASKEKDFVGLCDLIDNSSEGSGRLVSLRSKVKAASHYVTVLYDDSCAGDVVVLDVPDGIERKQGFEDMLRLVWEGYPNPRKTDTLIEVSGRFKFAEGDVPSRYLIVSEIRAVEAVPRPDK